MSLHRPIEPKHPSAASIARDAALSPFVNGAIALATL